MKMNSIKTVLLAITLILTGGCSKPVKTFEYFKQHPEEIQTEATRCMADAKNSKDITKDKNCMNVTFTESERCIAQKRRMGGGDDLLINCEDPAQMLAMAAQGF